jgi:hypothetical protein
MEDRSYYILILFYLKNQFKFLFFALRKKKQKIIIIRRRDTSEYLLLLLLILSLEYCVRVAMRHSIYILTIIDDTFSLACSHSTSTTTTTYDRYYDDSFFRKKILLELILFSTRMMVKASI